VQKRVVFCDFRVIFCKNGFIFTHETLRLQGGARGEKIQGAVVCRLGMTGVFVF
jgi:hypothetical protein